jgi:hypothetical protein
MSPVILAEQRHARFGAPKQQRGLSRWAATSAITLRSAAFRRYGETLFTVAKESSPDPTIGTPTTVRELRGVCCRVRTVFQMPGDGRVAVRYCGLEIERRWGTSLENWLVAMSFLSRIHA